MMGGGKLHPCWHLCAFGIARKHLLHYKQLMKHSVSSIVPSCESH